MTAPSWLVARPIAHRGLHDRAAGVVENSPTAAHQAIAGRFAIECDVQLTADGEAVVFHDFTLDRLTAEQGPVRERSTAELQGVGLTGSDDRILNLAIFLSRVGGRTPVVVEIKSRFDGDLTLTRRVVDVVSAYDGPVATKSFDPAVLAGLRQLAPDLPRGIVAQDRYDHEEWDGLSPSEKRRMAALLHWAETVPDFLSWRVGDLPSAAPHLCRVLSGVPVMTWTVRTDDDRRRAIAHADQMVFEGFRPDG